ncbi:hypothetical protein [Actinomyces gerencseriae]|uniref:hypothetical protein n=1 Tax=Actinomyces gerencseriae TaxID=52769 RepID=UPI00040F195B|nr:hypothetical protein [Actinomyces gerencseriae]
MSPRRKSLQHEHGQTLTEHAGIGLVVVVLILVVAGGITVASGDGIGQAIVCKIAQQIRSVAGGSYECPSSSNPYAANPAAVPSKVQETTKSTSAGVELIKVTGNVSDGSSVRRTTYADGSGSRQYSKTIEGSVGYSLGTGHSKKKEKAAEKNGEKSGDGEKTEKKGDGDPFKVSLEGSVKASGTITTTQTYKCDTPRHISCSEFDKQNRAATKERLRDQGIGRFRSGDKTIKQTPDTTSRAWNVKLSLKAGASISAGVKKNDKHKSKNEKSEKEKKDESSKKKKKKKDKTSAAAQSGINISGEAGYTNTSTTNADGSTSRSHRFAYKGTIDAADEIFGIEGGADDSYFGSYEVTYDGDGKLKTVTFTSVREGEASASKNKEHGKKGAGGSATTTITTTLDVSQLSPEDRAIAERYASSSFTNGALIVPPSSLKPSSPSDDDFDNLLYRQARTTRVVQNGKTVTKEGGWDLWLIKYKTESTTSTQDTISSQHLGRPGQDGERVYEDDTE